MRKFVLFVTAAFIMTCQLGVAAEIKIGAGAAPTENVLKPAKEGFEQSTGIKLSIFDTGPKQAFIDLERGTVEAAAAGLSFDDWVALLKKEGVPVTDPGTYKPVVIGKDSIVVLIHKDNQVGELSQEQLKGIFTGKIANWKEVGGTDLPIIVVWGSLTQGTNSFFSKSVLGADKVTSEVLQATNAPDIRQIVSVNPEAIGIGPAKIVNQSVKSPKTPEISRPITLITKGAPSETVQKLLNYLQRR